MLDYLATLELLVWQWEYYQPRRRAIYWVTESGKVVRPLETKRAEILVQRLCDQRGIVWLPVPSPGGELERAETLRRIDQLKQGIQPREADCATQMDSVTAISFDLAAYPELRECLNDEPANDRSAQVFRVACRCMEPGLSKGHAMWLLFQYPPFRDKCLQRDDTDRELNRLIARVYDGGTDVRRSGS
ncbi:hypothetical protein ACIBG4_31535 [Nonomuraea sp. NPDC050383]|uniref:hypothetical protein n=1 Tax=Nonomuraea sp. NPDC050383 TaxID=3364362 RepID=UPI0037AB8701